MNLVEASAKNHAAWADKQIRAHGIDCRYSEWLWTCWQSGQGTEIHHQAITLTSGSNLETPSIDREIEQLTSSRENERLEVVDWWQTLDLASLGFELTWNGDTNAMPYLVLPVEGRSSILPPPELEVARVTTAEELVEFERASFHGFDNTGEFRPGRWHAPSSIADRDMIYFAGRVDGQIVSVSISVISNGVIGIYGVATIPTHRRRGYGTAMTWAAVNSAPTLPAVLGPSDSGEPVYRKMGFRDFHAFRVWRRKST